MFARLVPVGQGKPIVLQHDVTLVGRDEEMCEMVVDSNSISKLQCIIVKTDGLLFIRDLGSTNGTRVNGQKVTRGALLPGDELSFASIKFKVELGPDRDEEEAGHHDKTEMITLNEDRPSNLASMASDLGSDSDVRLISDDSAG